jgi:saccharopine dehydrogenase (NAD+, L-lysine-forming)
MLAWHIWVRAESRDHEARVGIMPDGVVALIAAGCASRSNTAFSVPIADYVAVGAEIAAEAQADAPPDAR